MGVSGGLGFRAEARKTLKLLAPGALASTYGLIKSKAIDWTIRVLTTLPLTVILDLPAIATPRSCTALEGQQRYNPCFIGSSRAPLSALRIKEENSPHPTSHIPSRVVLPVSQYAQNSSPKVNGIYHMTRIGGKPPYNLISASECRRVCSCMLFPGQLRRKRRCM